MTQEAPIRLDDLSVQQLNEMASAIVGLKEAGYLMQEQGFDVRFSLVPGFPVSMKLSYRMPLPSPMQALFPPPPIDSDTATGQPVAPEWRATPMPKPAKPKGPTAAEVDAAVTEACDKVLPKAAAMAAEGPAEKLAVRPEPAPEPTPEPPKAESASIARPASSAPAATGQPAPWTEDETARALDIIRSHVRAGHSAFSAAPLIAEALGRPISSIQQRIKTNWRAAVDQIKASLVDPASIATPEPRDPPPAAVAEDQPQPIASPESTPTGSAHWRPEAAPAAVGLSPIEQHLMDMPTKGGWTMEADLDLLELAETGWSIPEIATEMGKDGKAVAERFDLLTGYDRETKARKWKRADLLAAAREWTAKTKPAAAAE